MTISDKNLRYCYLLIVPLILFFHFDLLVTDSILDRDDDLLISTVRETVSLMDYLMRLLKGAYFDIQPVRDLSFYLNIKCQELFGYGAFHLTNLLIGGGILFTFRKFLRKLKFEEVHIFCVIMLIAAHPVFNSSMAWVSNRKHLLSVFFILLYGLEEMKKSSNTPKSFLWIILSFLSQPITIFIPGSMVFYRRLAEKRDLNIWDKSILVFSGFFFCLNYFFYQNQPMFQGRNYIESLGADPTIYILNLCRAATQILFPVSIAIQYDPDNYLGFVGIALTIGVIFLVYRYKRGWKEVFLYLIILTTLYPVIRFGARDAYLLGTLLLSGYFLILILRNQKNKFLIFTLASIFIFFSVKSYKFTSMWIDDLTLSRVSYETEGGPMNMSTYAFHRGLANPREAFKYMDEVNKKYPTMANPMHDFNKARMLYYAPLTDEEKLTEFRKNMEPDIFATFFEAKLLSKLGEEEKSKNALKAIVLVFKRNPEVGDLFKFRICSDKEYLEDCKKLEAVEKQ